MQPLSVYEFEVIDRDGQSWAINLVVNFYFGIYGLCLIPDMYSWFMINFIYISEH